MVHLLSFGICRRYAEIVLLVGLAADRALAGIAHPTVLVEVGGRFVAVFGLRGVPALGHV